MHKRTCHLPLATCRSRGFTLIELMIVIGIIAVLGIVSLISLRGSKNMADLTGTAKLVASSLRQAQSQSVSGYQGVPWGVHFDNATNTTPFFALFYSSYATTTVVSRYALPLDVQFSASSVSPGSFVNVIFASISGIPSASTSITLNLGSGSPGGTSASVGRQSSGGIFFDNFNRSSL